MVIGTSFTISQFVDYLSNAGLLNCGHIVLFGSPSWSKGGNLGGYGDNGMDLGFSVIEVFGLNLDNIRIVFHLSCHAPAPSYKNMTVEYTRVNIDRNVRESWREL